MPEIDRATITAALETSWSATTSATPDEWSVDNPARGQCDASSFVLWERFGGSLVLGEVFVRGVRTEHHYWNRIDGVDVDVTASQFRGGEEIRELAEHDSKMIRARRAELRPELAARIDVLRGAVDDHLGALADAAWRQ